MESMTAAAIRLEAPVTRLAHWTAHIMAYIAARIQLVVKRRMKASNLADVGQMRSRKGTSMKRMMNEQALQWSEWWIVIAEIWPILQADDGENDAEDGGEDVGNAEGKAQDHAHHAGPKKSAVRNMFPLQPDKSQRYPKPSMTNRHPLDISPQCLFCIAVEARTGLGGNIQRKLRQNNSRN